uniref:Uncharacterized protein n=1 Tax=Anguilla anguilla TaxID=7936 RepID=A0A0E9S3X7_ANGAN
MQYFPHAARSLHAKCMCICGPTCVDGITAKVKARVHMMFPRCTIHDVKNCALYATKF